MHLPERGGGRGLMLEFGESVLPAGAELGGHAPLDEGPAHRRGFALELLQFLDIFGRQQVGDGRHQLRDLHDRPLQAAKRCRELGRILAPVDTEPNSRLAANLAATDPTLLPTRA